LINSQKPNALVKKHDDSKQDETFQHEGQIVMNGKDLSNTSRTNWAALEAMDDEGIDYSDIPPLTEAFFEKATVRIPASQAQRLV
jgi:hypothetical protein